MNEEVFNMAVRKFLKNVGSRPSGKSRKPCEQRCLRAVCGVRKR
jgi:hypothetical protein